MMSTESGRTIPNLLVALGLTVALVMMATPAQAAVGDLTAKAFLTPPELSIPDSVAVSPDGRSVYVTAQSDDAIYLFSRNTTSGALTAKGCVEDNDTGPGTCVLSTDGLDGPSSVAVSPDGKSVYVTSGFDSAITRFTRNTTSGALKPKGCIDDIQSGDDTCATELERDPRVQAPGGTVEEPREAGGSQARWHGGSSTDWSIAASTLSRLTNHSSARRCVRACGQ